MFEDDDVLEFNMPMMNTTCSFCGKHIKDFPASSIDGRLKFCDLICAKLFYDNNEHFTLDIKKYNNYYNEGQLSKKARDIFERCNGIVFEQLPIYKPVETDPTHGDAKLMRKIYNKTLTPGLFKFRCS